MTDLPTLWFRGARGGAGATTAAVLAALQIEREEGRVTLACPDAPEVGVADTDTLKLVSRTDNPDVYEGSQPPLAAPSINIVCIAGPSYQMMKSLSHLRESDHVDIVFLLREPWRALGVKDVQVISGVERVVEFAHNPAVARAADAGLLPREAGKDATRVGARLLDACRGVWSARQVAAS